MAPSLLLRELVSSMVRTDTLSQNSQKGRGLLSDGADNPSTLENGAEVLQVQGCLKTKRVKGL